MLLTLPATLALAVGVRADHRRPVPGRRATPPRMPRITGNILAILVTGLPAYVLVKVLTPGFYARKDMKTPVRIAIGVLVASVAANFLLIPVIGIYSLAAVTSAGAWLNVLLLFAILAARGHFPCRAGWSGRIVAATARRGGDGGGALCLLQRPARRLLRRLGGAPDPRGRRAGLGRRHRLFRPRLVRSAASIADDIKALFRREPKIGDGANDACRFRHPADRQPPSRQLSRRDPALGEAAGRGRMPDLPRRSPRDHRLQRPGRAARATSTAWPPR